MKKLVTGHTFTLRGVPYICDVLVGLYATSKRPCILLVDSKEFTEGWQGTVTTATANPPPGFLQGFQSESIPFKTWAENEGLLEQLLSLKDEDGLTYFLPARSRDGTSHLSITLGFCKAPVYSLRGKALELYRELLNDFHEEGEQP